jgi:hypothetical protein
MCIIFSILAGVALSGSERRAAFVGLVAVLQQRPEFLLAPLNGPKEVTGAGVASALGFVSALIPSYDSSEESADAEVKAVVEALKRHFGGFIQSFRKKDKRANKLGRIFDHLASRF